MAHETTVICQRRGLALDLFCGFGSQGTPRVGWMRGLLGSCFQRLGGWSRPAVWTDKGLSRVCPSWGSVTSFLRYLLFVVKEMRLVELAGVWMSAQQMALPP